MIPRAVTPPPSTVPAPVRATIRVVSPTAPAAPAKKLHLIQPMAEPVGYYAAAQGKQGAALLTALGSIAKNGHIDVGYNVARDAMFGNIDDRTGQNQVADIYTGRVENNVSGRRSAFEHGLNAEHTWPQSRGATGIAKADLHQLMPADIEYNAKRGHHPYGEVKRTEWSTPGNSPETTSKLGVDATGEIVFEPRPAVRGDIARGLLYFYTRYANDRPSQFTTVNFKHEIPTLLKWNKEDPVDAVEQRRNDAVFSVQNNRNPYIDHPEFVPAVGDAWNGAHILRPRAQPVPAGFPIRSPRPQAPMQPAAAESK